MSQVYSTEPQTSGRVILDTSHGPIDIHLFCKECPTTCRSFLQLALDGYYDNLMFHRCIDNFLIQTGERYIPSTIEDRGYKFEAYDIEKKKLEVIPRIKFNHRGQLAWALPLEEDGNSDSATRASLSRQFFITMDETPFLDKKYVIFGTIRGDTIFNALRIGKTETLGDSGEVADKDNPPKIKSVRIEHHLFGDLVATNEELVPWKMDTLKEENSIKKRRKKRKGKRDLNVLSFGGEMEDADDGMIDSRRGMQSSHDQHTNDKVNKVKAMGKLRRDRNIHPQQPDRKRIKDLNTQSSEQEQVGKGLRDSFKNQKERNKYNAISDARISVPDIEKETSTSGKKESVSTSALEARRMKYLSGRGTRKASKKRDALTMSKLSQFKNKMFEVKGMEIEGDKMTEGSLSRRNNDNSIAARMAKRLESAESKREENNKAAPIAYSGQVLEEDDLDYKGGNRSWLKNRFKCRRHIDHDLKDDALGGDGRKAEDYEVIDEKRSRFSYERENHSKRSHH